MFTGHIDGVGPYEIARLDLGTLTIPEGTPMGGRVLAVHGFLVFHPEGRLLFDTGLGADCPEFDRLLSPVRRPLEDALASHDVKPADIAVVVNCHLHYDHCGGNPLLPGVRVYVQKREYEASQDAAFYVRDRIDFPGADLRFLDGEAEILPGVRVISTPGHTAGHQSLVIHDAEGSVVLAGQTAYTVEEFVGPEKEPARGARTAWDRNEFLKSIEYIHGLRPRRVYFSHDADAWEPTRS